MEVSDHIHVPAVLSPARSPGKVRCPVLEATSVKMGVGPCGLVDGSLGGPQLQLAYTR